MSDKCPKCGAEAIRGLIIDSLSRFRCGSEQPRPYLEGLGDKHKQSDACRIRELESENERLRKILAHVPGRIAIKAKEDAGFGVQIRTMENQSDSHSS